jgi:hypothetical protein
MARLYVVAFSGNNRWARHLARLLLYVYNPDSPSGHAPLGLIPVIVPAQFARERTNFS